MRTRMILIFAIVSAGLLLATSESPLVRGARAPAPVARSAQPVAPQGSTRVFKLSPVAEMLTSLNAQSLTSERHGRSIAIGPRSFLATRDAPTIQTSVNGTKFAVQFTRRGHSWASKPSQVTLQVFNARNGSPLWPRVHPQVPFMLLGISADGSQLFGARAGVDLNASCTGHIYYVLNARTGHVIHSVTVRENHMWEPMLIGPSLHYLYVLNEPDQVSSCGVWHGPFPTLTAYNLVSGRPTGSVRLASVKGGSWRTGFSSHGEPVTAIQQPGFALSPDGSQIAVLDGSINRLTLLHARSLTTEASESLTRPSSTLDRLAGALGLLPPAADAKEIQGTSLQMSYTANGRSLLVSGTRSRIVRSRRFPVPKSLGLRLIDVATGRVMADASGKKQIYGVWAAPDGSAVYTMVPGSNSNQLCPCTYQRRDPGSLRVMSSHTFWDDTGWSIYLLSASRR